MKLYERIEDLGVDEVCRRVAPQRRDRLIEETEDDEIVYYFIAGLTAPEFRRLWSAPVIERTIARIPAPDLFTSIHYLSYPDIPRLFSAELIRERMEEMSGFELVRCLFDYAAEIQYLVRSYGPKTLSAARGLTLAQLEGVCRLRSGYESIFAPIFRMAYHSIFPVKAGSPFRKGDAPTIRSAARRTACTDLRAHIMSFIKK